MKKVIRLTEADIENIVRRVIKEQEQSSVENVNQSVLDLPNFNNLFPIGQYEDTDGKIKAAIDSQKPKIIEFIQQNPQNPEFTAQINSGESQITNPAGFKQKGSLALARAKTVSTLLKDTMSDLIADGYFTIIEPTLEEVKIGTTPYSSSEFVKACGANKEKMQSAECKEYLKPYNEEQFVNIKVSGKGESLICNTELQIKGKQASAPNFEYLYEKELGVAREMTGILFKAFTIPDRPIIISDKGQRVSPPYFVRETKSNMPSEDQKYYMEMAMLRYLYPDSPAFAGVETVVLYQSDSDKNMPSFMNVIDSRFNSILGKKFKEVAEKTGGINKPEIKKVVDEIDSDDESRLTRKIFTDNFESLFKPMWSQCPKIKTQSRTVFNFTREQSKTIRVGSYAPLDETIFSITPICS